MNTKKLHSSLRRARHKRWKGIAGRLAEKWDEDTTEFCHELLIDAESYSVDPLFPLPPAKRTQLGDSITYQISPEGSFAYQNRVVPAFAPLLLHHHGYVMFTGDVVVPALIDLGRDFNGKEFNDSVEEADRVRSGFVWMSLTPNEMMSQRDGLSLARGTVVIGGLGLGWFLRKVCEKEAVTNVVLVEQSQELLDWYGYDLCSRYSKVTSVVCDDIYQQIGQFGEEAIYLLDIWPVQEGANHDPQFRVHKARLGERLWGWGFTGDGCL